MGRIRCISFIAAAILGWCGASAQELNLAHPNHAYDSLVAEWKTNKIFDSFDNYEDYYITMDSAPHKAIGVVSELVYQERLNSLICPIHLPYNNIIKERIVAYTTTHKSLVERALAYSQYYFPMIEEELQRQGLPLELKFLPVIESAFTPTATSRAGAVGLWQLMLATGRQYGLEITSMVDERRDPIASTRAACAFLKDMYKIYGDWTLALASYNYGPGNVNKALSRSKAENKTYWDIYPYLPRETRDYIPGLVAVIYAYNYYQEHNLKASAPPIPLAIDTVMVNRNMHLGQVSSTLDMPLELLQLLNPQYKQDIIPAAGKSYSLVLPQQEISRFIENEEVIYAKDSVYLAEYLKPGAVAIAQQAAIGDVYRVKSGDTLSGIAKKYGTTVARIKQWNGLSSDRLSIGQSLRIN